MLASRKDDEALRRTVVWVALLNVAYFGVEFAVGLAIGSVSLFADSIDFLEDASVNVLIAIALGWSAPARSSRHVARAHLARTGAGWSLDRVAEASFARAACSIAIGANGHWSPRHQSLLRVYVGEVSPS